MSDGMDEYMKELAIKHAAAAKNPDACAEYDAMYEQRRGTFDCPICGVGKPHGHTEIEQKQRREIESLRSQLAQAQQYIYDLTNPETGEVPTLEAQLAELKQKLALNELSNDDLARTERYEFLLAEKNAEVAGLKKELAKHQMSEFHPDWSMLEACRDGNMELRTDLLSAQATIARLRESIKKCLDENGHLADGEVCTLIDLKRALALPTDDQALFEFGCRVAEKVANDAHEWNYMQDKIEDIVREVMGK